MMQGVLFAAVRACDGMPKEDESKKVVRALRAVVLKSARLEGSFLAQHPTIVELRSAMCAVTQDYDKYPMHFFIHLIHAAEIVGYMCVADSSMGWLKFYKRAVAALHLHPETRAELLERLSDDPSVHENETGFNELAHRPDIKSVDGRPA